MLCAAGAAFLESKATAGLGQWLEACRYCSRGYRTVCCEECPPQTPHLGVLSPEGDENLGLTGRVAQMPLS